ncbi:hypothetical protein PRK78_005613 [Emydomyces testavorans]|uniref:ELYS-like domain-containing protein n=1 Tax=Emydomyces testavorans TaxID=2070801 RepID=A0AAF0DL14_9EURO|nr:hypothetical protein PRK78_005613 [Emydomyces testavorans]
MHVMGLAVFILRNNFQRALEYLTEPSLIPTFPDEILYVLSTVPKQDHSLAVAYYIAVSPPLASREVLEAYFAVLCRTGITTAFYFTRKQPDETRRELLNQLIFSVLSTKSGETRAENAMSLVNLPFNDTEVMWFEECLLSGKAKHLPGAADTAMMRRVAMGRLDNLGKLESLGGRKIEDRCKNEHPGSQSLDGNRFGIFQTGGGPGIGGFGPTGQEDPRKKYALNADDIKSDLTPGKGRPQWIFSAYGPGKQAPIQLFGGPDREQSFEEMRAIHYAAAASGNVEKAIQDANNLYADTDSQIQSILNDLEGAIKYIINGANQHPNRIDITEGRMTASAAQQGVLGTGTTAAPSALGQPSSFPQPGPSTTSAFGPRPVLGQTQQPAFGKPAFGQPSFGQATSCQSGFGQPSSFGQTGGLSDGQPAFGQPSTLKPSPFSQPLSQGPMQPNPFNQMSGVSPFTQLASQGQPFSQPQNQAQAQSPFEKLPATSAFGQASPSTAAFSSFGTEQQSSRPFPQQSTFGTPGPTTQPTSEATALPVVATPLVQETKKAAIRLTPLPKLGGETRRDPTSKKLLLWKGQPIRYIDNEPCFQHPDDPGTFVHIYFPDGPPAPESFKSSVGKPEQYTPEIEMAYKYLKQHGALKDGIMPPVPPRPEWCSFDL